MTPFKTIRKRQLEQLTRDAIISVWQEATKSTNPPAGKMVRQMIDEILEAEYPANAKSNAD